jgi:pimeloyl-ACP methyl ester carboxylesterase
MGNLTGFFGSVLAVYGLLLGGMFVFQRSLLYFPPADRPVLGSVGGSGIEAVTVTTEDGLDLVHWYRPPVTPDGPVVAIFHGNAGHIGDRVPKYWPLLKAGFGVFFAEYRGYGGNPGSPTEEGLTADGHSVMSHLTAQGIAPERIVLYGESLGTGVAIKLAAEHPVAGLVLEAPPGAIAELAQAHY